MPHNGDCPRTERTVDSTVLLDLDLFRVSADNATRVEKIALAYHRARAIAKLYDFTTGDIQCLTEKFWHFHQDMIHTLDSAAFSLLAIQYNLCVGTLAPFLEHRPDLKAIVEPLLSFDISGQFLLAEVGHGLDAHAIETVATLLPGGTFDLHTPNPDAAKVLPGRAGSKTLDHCITSFEHVRLPHTALLGTLDAPADRRKSFQSTIHRVYIGTLALSTVLISALKSSVFVAGKYSFRRHIWGPTNEPRPIIFFRPQHRPILHTLAQIAVYDPYAAESIQNYMDTKIPYVVRQGVATAFKAVLHRATQESLCYLGERCDSLEEVQRTGEFNRRILPRCQTLVEAVGHRMAYEAGLDSGVVPELLDLYEAGVMLQHSGWFVENLGLDMETQFNMEMQAMNGVLPRLEHLLEATGAEPYCTAPIVSNEAWAEFVNGLEVYKGNARMDICEYDEDVGDTVSIFGFLRESG
ncbi:hypothetical protein BDV32DRAFT_136331 [Aspergillus pseudonomiae]|uniref:Uncharacterized protein n=1 Tax=Aspergillus pseudonomiae TaxID=1506151 RepID=A0A5N7DIG2_9EURO|nr:uncharacterized protein BDV37DRAFT_270131 [Aspergillus pseudonomiae]KAB8262926.1 hypothetical protein BDV32DRAFT_136331 [Aspergillus pseudonomiae]KAE8406230.1 hypothetical protein BDV37DRAFT_270131 [Aspergillus pseudonomiae]